MTNSDNDRIRDRDRRAPSHTRKEWNIKNGMEQAKAKIFEENGKRTRKEVELRGGKNVEVKMKEKGDGIVLVK